MPKLCIVLSTYIYCLTCTIPVSPPAASSCPSDRKLPEYACNQHRSWETINVWAEPHSLYTMQHHLVGNKSIPNNHLKSFISGFLLSICSSRRFGGCNIPHQWSAIYSSWVHKLPHHRPQPVNTLKMQSDVMNKSTLQPTCPRFRPAASH
jgi:hypothetical protein